MSQLALSASFEYISYGSAAIIIFVILCVRSAQRGVLREINIDTLISTLTRRDRH